MFMLYLKAFHLIAMVAWFAGLFYLPRLFVYHQEASFDPMCEQFRIMERRLYYAIVWPAGIMTTLSGLWLLWGYKSGVIQCYWMQMKLLFVLGLWGFHLICGHYVHVFKKENSPKESSVFFRVFNEIPTVILIAVMFLIVLKPWR